MTSAWSEAIERHKSKHEGQPWWLETREYNKGVSKSPWMCLGTHKKIKEVWEKGHRRWDKGIKKGGKLENSRTEVPTFQAQLFLFDPTILSSTSCWKRSDRSPCLEGGCVLLIRLYVLAIILTTVMTIVSLAPVISLWTAGTKRGTGERQWLGLFSAAITKYLIQNNL
jgi:hypothetical protein